MTFCRNLAVPWTLLNITKLVLSLTLVLLPISDLLYLVYVYQGGGVVAQVHIVANIIRAATYLLALLLMLNCKRRGEVTSGTLFIYWLVATACAAVTFRYKASCCQYSMAIVLSEGPLWLIRNSLLIWTTCPLFFFWCRCSRPELTIGFLIQIISPVSTSFCHAVPKLLC